MKLTQKEDTRLWQWQILLQIKKFRPYKLEGNIFKTKYFISHLEQIFIKLKDKKLVKVLEVQRVDIY